MAIVSHANTHAAGFSLQEQSASNMGNAYAGAAVSAEDATTIFANPAGMTYLPDTQLVVGTSAILSSVQFTNTSSRSGLGIQSTAGNGGDAGDLIFLPDVYFSKSVAPNIHLGIAINAPFGLKTEYDNNWVGRYQAIKSDLKTININPSIAFKTSEKLSLGFGISAMRTDATLTSAVDFGTLLGNPQKSDGLASISGNSWAWGWNSGAIWQVDDATRLGLSYRSQVHQRLEGRVNFSGVPAPLSTTANFQNSDVTADFNLPDSLSASLFHQWNSEWDLLADITWTHWDKFQNLTVVRNTGAIVSSTQEDWRNTLRVSAGTTYHYSDVIKLRGGIAFDQTPVSTANRTARIPDNNRYWLSFGGNYKFAANTTLDVGYTHLFIADTAISQVTNSSIAALRDTLIGNYDNSADIIAAQLNYSF